MSKPTAPTPSVVTLTLNPALDLSSATDTVVHTDKLRCEAGRYDPGGGGLNVARVVATLGGEATAIYPVGGAAGQMLRRLVDAKGLRNVAVPIEGETRISFTVSERSSGNQYRFVLPGPHLSPDEQDICLEALSETKPHPAAVVVSGSLPPGISSDYLARVGRLAADRGARFFLDTSGPALHGAAGSGIYLVKPNLRELSAFVDRPLPSSRARIAAGQEMRDRLAAEVVVVSLGAEGVMIVTAEHVETLPAPAVTVRSSVGAGDSMMGAIAMHIAAGATLRDAVRYGLAAGSAALLTDGTELCRRDDTERLYAELYAVTRGP